MTFEPEDFRDDPDHDVQQLAEIAVRSPVTPAPAAPSPEAAERMRLMRLLAERRLAVRGINLPYAPQQDLRDALDEVLCGVDLIREAGLPQPTVHLLADSFSGKSTGARTYIREVMARGEHRPGTIPVAYAKLDTDGTVGSLAADILTALGEKRPTALTPDKRWDRARQAIRDHGVQLFIFDEFQRAGRRPTISPVIGGKILDIMDGDDKTGGDCAIAFLGKRTAISVFKSCPDLRNRLDRPVTMPPLIWTTDGEDFMEFADAFDQALVDAGITAVKSGLGKEESAKLLLEASNGLIGQFSRIVETAVIMITREGHDAITRTDLRDAVQEWSIGNGRIGYNPFVKSRSDDEKASKGAAQSDRKGADKKAGGKTGDGKKRRTKEYTATVSDEVLDAKETTDAAATEVAEPSFGAAEAADGGEDDFEDDGAHAFDEFDDPDADHDGLEGEDA